MWTYPRRTGTIARSAVEAIFVALALAPAAISNAAPPSGPVPVWSTNFIGPGAASIDARKTTSRLLADASFMVAAGFNTANSGRGVTAARYDSAGNVLSTISVIPAVNSVLALDPFGGLFVFGSISQGGALWLMKYDGLSGRSLWAAPAIFQEPGSTNHGAVALAIDGRGDVLASGSVVGAAGNSDWITLKFDGKSGGLLWGPAHFDGAAHANDSPLALALDGAGNAVVTGRSGNGSDDDLAIVKYSGATGAQLWSRVFAGPVFSFDVPAAVAVDRAGNVVVCGSSKHPGGTTNDFMTLKYDGATGAPLWGPVYFDGTGHGNDSAVALTLDASGNAFVSGLANSGSGTDIATLKYDGASGALVWGPALLAAPGGGPGTPQIALAVNGAGDLVLTGQRTSATIDYCTVRYNGRTGALLWGPSVFHAPAGAIAAPSAVFVDGAGDVLTTASQLSGTATAAATLKYSGATGGTLWGPVLLTGAGGAAILSSNPLMTTDGAGNVVATGSGGGGGRMVKLAAGTGAILWGPVTFPSTPTSVAVDGSGDVFVAYNTSNGTDMDAFVSKFNGASGAVMWGPVTIDRGSGLYEYAFAVNADASGNVIVSGTTGLSPQQVFSVKCNGTTGAILWGPTVYGPDLNLDGLAYPQLFFQALDVAGNAIVLTEPWSLAPPIPPFSVYTPDFSTLKINGATGALAWGPNVYGGPNGTSDLPTALAVDSAGDVLVAGGSGPNVALLKYSGATGATVWGPALQASASYPSVAADGTGNVTLSATSGVGNSTDIVTLKYDGASGVPLWGPIVYDSAGADRAGAVAVDGSGDVIIAGTSSTSSFLGLVLLKYSGIDGGLVWGPSRTNFAGDERFLSMRLVGNDPVLLTGYLNGAFAARYSLALGILNPAELPPVLCGQSDTLPLEAENGVGPYSWTVVAGNPPPGMSLDIFGVLSGTPAAAGTFAFRVRVTDGTSAFVEKDLSLTVVDAGSWLPVAATANPVCAGGGTTLSVSGTFSSYLWLPGGETSPTVTVSPAHPTLYGVVVTDSSGCPLRGTARVDVGPVPAAAPTIATPAFAGSGSPGRVARIASPAGGSSYAWSITNGTITAGQGTSQMTFTAGGPGPLSIQVTETTGAGCTSPIGSANVTVVGAQSALQFYALPPCRILDTRNPNGPLGGPALVASASRLFTLTGSCGVPATAKSVSANVTVTQPAAGGALIVYPGDQGQPGTSTINFRAGQTRANNALLLLATDGSGRVAVQNGSTGSVHVILDVNGYFQ